MNTVTDMRTAIIHDWLNQIGGAENVLETLVAMFPNAPVFTSMYWPEKMPREYRRWDIRTSFTNHLPGIHKHHQRYLLAYPWAFSQIDLTGYDLVLSNKSGFCHNVRAQPGATHICYCLTPTRYVWHIDEYLKQEGFNPALKSLIRALARWLRRRDLRACEGVDHFIAISSEVQQRIARLYGRESVIIHPPVETSQFQPIAKPDNYFLVVSRLIPYKRIDLAVEAFTALNLPLIVAGEGRDRVRLQASAGPTVKFLGRVSREELADLMAHCKALIFPGLEDFGISPVEAMASGRPVIAFASGGALDYIREGETGCFFRKQSVQDLARTVQQFDSQQFDSRTIRQFALRFDRSIFEQKLRRFIDLSISKGQV